jgi:hypothetical protein
VNIEEIQAKFSKKAEATVKAGEYPAWASELKDLAKAHYEKIAAPGIIDQATGWFNSQPEMARHAMTGAAIGGLGGAVTGLARNAISPRRKKNYLGDMFGYGLAGAGLGAGAGALYNVANMDTGAPAKPKRTIQQQLAAERTQANSDGLDAAKKDWTGLGMGSSKDLISRPILEAKNQTSAFLDRRGLPNPGMEIAAPAIGATAGAVSAGRSALASRAHNPYAFKFNPEDLKAQILKDPVLAGKVNAAYKPGPWSTWLRNRIPFATKYDPVLSQISAEDLRKSMAGNSSMLEAIAPGAGNDPLRKALGSDMNLDSTGKDIATRILKGRGNVDLGGTSFVRRALFGNPKAMPSLRNNSATANLMRSMNENTIAARAAGETPAFNASSIKTKPPSPGLLGSIGRTVGGGAAGGALGLTGLALGNMDSSVNTATQLRNSVAGIKNNPQVMARLTDPNMRKLLTEAELYSAQSSSPRWSNAKTEGHYDNLQKLLAAIEGGAAAPQGVPNGAN